MTGVHIRSSLPTNLTNVPPPQMQRSSFDRSHTYKTTFDAGYLVPFYLDEVLPGDTFNLNATLFGRLATPIFPIMDNLHLDTQFFFVPKRLLWTNFKKFMGEQDNPTDSTSFLLPVFDRATYPVLGFDLYSVYDYFGLPILSATASMTFDLTCMPLRAYNFIWNQWYRDENVQDSVVFNTDNGPDDYADYVLLRRSKRKDYFTGALPWPQKDFGAVPRIPVTDTSIDVPVEISSTYLTAAQQWDLIPTGEPAGAPTWVDIGTSSVIRDGTGSEANMNPNTTLQTSFALDPNMLGTINELRVAVQLQRFMERDARGGTRYSELVMSHFKIHTPDLFWKPEYLGGSSTRINISPVAQQSETGTTPQGNQAGFGTVLSSPRFIKSFNEHGYVIGLCSVRADLNYQQNVDRLWLRSTKLDLYWPTFAHLGEQAILQTEILFDAGRLQPGLVFGYQERYAEYRYKPNTITGLFRSQAPASLDAWHLAQEFLSNPVLDATFIQENPPVDRIIAVPAEPHMIMDVGIDLKCARPMPIQSVPGLMDHF